MPGIAATIREFKKGKLHSGSQKGPKVTSKDQAIAIGLSQQRKSGKKGESMAGLKKASQW